VRPLDPDWFLVAPYRPMAGLEHDDKVFEVLKAFSVLGMQCTVSKLKMLVSYSFSYVGKPHAYRIKPEPTREEMHAEFMNIVNLAQSTFWQNFEGAILTYPNRSTPSGGLLNLVGKQDCYDLIYSFELEHNFQYDYIIYLRADAYWMLAHPPPNVWSPDHIIIPEGEDYGGLNDRHVLLIFSICYVLFCIYQFVYKAIIPRKYAEQYFTRWNAFLTGRMETWLRASGWDHSSHHKQQGTNPERILDLVLRNPPPELGVEEFPSRV